MYTYKFHKKVEKDLGKLDSDSRALFTKSLKKILSNPEIWKDLWNKWWFNLSWYKKLYFDRKKKRIVYKIIKNEIRIYIISVWERDDMSVYKEAFSRLSRW